MYQVKKRDGQVTEFTISKITGAITKAFVALNKAYHPSVIDLLALHVTADFESEIKDGYIAVEDIQDSVERCCPSPAMPTWPRLTSCTANSGRKSGT